MSATLLKVTLLHGCFLRFLDYTNGTKLHKTSHPRTPFKVFESPTSTEISSSIRCS